MHPGYSGFHADDDELGVGGAQLVEGSLRDVAYVTDAKLAEAREAVEQVCEAGENRHALVGPRPPDPVAPRRAD